MSISTQPAARHASLQRALSARLNAPSSMDVAALRTAPADKMQRAGVATVDYVSWPQLLDNCTAHTPCNDSSLSCPPQLTALPAEGLLPAVASEPSQIQARKRASLNCQPTCSLESGQVHPEAATSAGDSAQELLKQSSKRVRLSPVTCADVTLAEQAASLEDEYAAMKAGTAVIADRAAWVAAARHTAHQLQQEARCKVLKAFKAALRYMDEDTLQSHMAMHLQLQPSPKQEEVGAKCADSSLQAPQALSCPRKPRTRRCPRPASAASVGLAREPSLNRPVSAPAECSGWDWGQGLPSATSALLQAVEVAAAAEPGEALLPSPPSWKRHHPDAGSPSLHLTALKSPADIATAAVAAPASQLASASDAHTHLPEQTAANPVTRLSPSVATSSSFRVDVSQVALPVFCPGLQRPSQQGCTAASPLLEQAGKAAQLATTSNTDCAAPLALCQGLTRVPPLGNSGDLVRPPSADQVWLWRQQAAAGAQPAVEASQPGQWEQLNSMLPVLQSPFAAIATLPVHDQPIQIAAAQSAPRISALGQNQDPQVSSPLADAEAAAQAATQANLHAQCLLLRQPKLTEQQGSSSAQKLQRERPLPGSGKKTQPTLRPPLSPSRVRSNGEASILQPLAKAQSSLLHPGSGLPGSSSKPQSTRQLNECKLGLTASQPVLQSELLPGRNVVVSTAGVTDLAHLLIPPAHWCWVARIDKVMASHMRVSWYGKHNGRWTLARHIAGPDEGQVRTGDVGLFDHQILAVFDRFTGNKEIPAETVVSATAQLASIEPVPTAHAGDQENRVLACVSQVYLPVIS